MNTTTHCYTYAPILSILALLNSTLAPTITKAIDPSPGRSLRPCTAGSRTLDGATPTVAANSTART